MLSIAAQSRSTLQGILGMCQLLRDSELSAKDRRCVEAIAGLSEMLLELFQDVVDFHRIQVRQLHLHDAVWDWRSWMEANVLQLEVRAAAKGLKFRCDWDPGIGPNLRGDPWRMRQVLRLLFANAVQFTNTGEVGLRVSLVQDLPKESILRFEIADTGVGFEPEKAEHVQSSGMGLKLSEGILSLMGSQLLLRSRPGQGSAVAFVLRLSKAENGIHGVREHGDPQGPTSNSPSRGEVLILTGDPGSQLVLECFLVSMGLTVALAETPARALEMVSEIRFRLIVIDVDSLPFDASNFAQRLGAMEPMAERTPLLALVPQDSSLSKEHYRNVGFTDCVRKPLVPEDWFPYLAR